MCFCQDLIGSDFVVMVDCRVFSQVWNLANCKLKTNHIGHTGYVNTVTVSPDGSLCASGGKVSFPLAALIWVFGLWFVFLFVWMCDVARVSVFRMDRPCCGIWMKESTCTRWTVVTSSTLSASVQTDTGCVPLRGPASRSGYELPSRFLADSN